MKLDNIHIQSPKDAYMRYPNPLSSPYSCCPFEKNEIFIPNATIEFSYHLKEKPKTIEIVANKGIWYLSNKRRFNF